MPSGRGSITIVDDFSREESGEWGAVGPVGWEYTPTAGESLALSVDGDKAVARAPAGVTKGNFLIGPTLEGSVGAQATFAVDRIVRAGEQNHAQLLLKAQGERTYYGFQLYPNFDRRATATVFSAKDNRFEALGQTRTSFTVQEEHPYSIQARAQEDADRIVLRMKAWPAGEAEPSNWTLVAADDTDPITAGRAGVRLSFYAGPAAMFVDDFFLRAPGG